MHGSVIKFLMNFLVILFYINQDLTSAVDNNYDLSKTTHFISLNNNI